MSEVKEFKTTIEKIYEYSDSLKVFKLKLPEDSDFSFVSGQFVMLSIPNVVDDNDRPISKAYSIASSSEKKGFIELCIAKLENGKLSPKIFQTKEGDEITIKGPYGVLNLKKPVQPGTVFIAGGTGLAPLMSMIRSIYDEGFSEKLWLFYSIHKPDQFLFKEEFLRYESEKGLKLVPSTSKPSSEWKWEHGHVTETFQKHAINIPKDSQFYICGPPSMVANIMKMLEELGYDKDNIHKEQW
jgi:propane monooxygenase reductase component